MALCMGSRFANRVYVILEEARITDFDTFFSRAQALPWGQFLPRNMPIVVDGASSRSALSSISTIQSLTERAIRTHFTPAEWAEEREEVHVLVLILEDSAHFMIDVTGDPLHMR